MAGHAHGIRAGSAYVELFADSSALVRGLKLAESRLKKFGASLSKIGGTMMGAGMGLTFAGMATTAPIVMATKSYMAFSDAMLATRAALTATDAEYESLLAKANELGLVTSFTTTEVANAMLQLARGGFSVTEIDASIASMLDLARASGTDLPLATEIAAATLRRFRLEASEMTRVADVLTAAANLSALSVEDIGTTLEYVGPLAWKAGLSLEDTSKAIGTLANMGIKGSMAGTSLRQILAQISTVKIQDMLRAEGVEALDSSRNLRKLGDVMIDIGKAMAGMTNAQQLSWMRELFDQRAMTAGVNLATVQFDRLNEGIDAASGTAREQAVLMDSEVGGAWRRFTSALDVAANAVGKALTPTLMRLSQILREGIEMITRFATENQNVIVIVSALSAGLVVLGPALVGLGGAMMAASITIGMVITSLGVVGSALSLLLTPVGAVGAAVVAMTAIFLTQTETGQGIWQGFVGTIMDILAPLKSTFDETFKAIADAVAAGDITLAFQALGAGLKVELLQIQDMFASAWESITRSSETPWLLLNELEEAMGVHLGKRTRKDRDAEDQANMLRRANELADARTKLTDIAKAAKQAADLRIADAARAAAVAHLEEQAKNFPQFGDAKPFSLTDWAGAKAGGIAGGLAQKVGGLWDAITAADWGDLAKRGLGAAGAMAEGIPWAEPWSEDVQAASTAAESMATQGTFSSVAAMRMGGVLAVSPMERAARAAERTEALQAGGNKLLSDLVAAAKKAKLVFTGQLGG